MKNDLAVEYKNVYDLPVVDNVCNQILREVISLAGVSIAHVVMEPGNVSLLHKHSRMSEIYFILGGRGILYHNNRILEVEKGAYLALPPDTSHKLENAGNCNLEHLVLAVPPFDAGDVILLNEKISDRENSQIAHVKFENKKAPIKAQDGAIIYELLSKKEREIMNVALAVGSLPPKRKAIPHFHKASNEIYYIISGRGVIEVEDSRYEAEKDRLIYIPANFVHALENTSKFKNLDVLCVSAPAYSDEDFYK